MMDVYGGLTMGDINYFATFMRHDVDPQYKRYKQICTGCSIRPLPTSVDFSQHVVSSKHSAYPGWWICLKCSKCKKFKKKPQLQFRSRDYMELFAHLKDVHYDGKEMSK